jgi:hypothetical protein
MNDKVNEQMREAAGGPSTPQLSPDAEALTFAVNVTVREEPAISRVFLSVDPERVLLNGEIGNKIVWKVTDPAVARFESAEDVVFSSVDGKARFPVVFNPSDGTITGIVTGDPERNETIYAYKITVHFPKYGVAIQMDPEVDNPPPVPRP